MTEDAKELLTKIGTESTLRRRARSRALVVGGGLVVDVVGWGCWWGLGGLLVGGCWWGVVWGLGEVV